MVALVRDLANIQLSTTISSLKYLNLCSTLNMEEDIDMVSIRERTLVGSKNNSRDLSIISATLFRLYHKHIEIQNLNTL